MNKSTQEYYELDSSITEMIKMTHLMLASRIEDRQLTPTDVIGGDHIGGIHYKNTKTIDDSAILQKH